MTDKFPESPKPKQKTKSKARENPYAKVFHLLVLVICSKTLRLKNGIHPKFSKTLTTSLKDKSLIQVMNNDPYYNFCLEEIRFYTEKINEIIKEGLKDPKKYYEESKSDWKKIYQMIPVMYMINQMEDSKSHT